MKISTMSIVIGDDICNAGCPFCVAQQTGFDGVPRHQEINWRNANIASRCAEKGGVTTVLFTGKGEPTIYPKEITNHLGALEEMEEKGLVNFPFKELQTNGMLLMRKDYEEHLRNWFSLGLTTIAISVVHYDTTRNKEIYGEKSPNLAALIHYLHGIGFSVRLSVMLLKDYIDTPEEIEKLIDFCKANKVEQLTVRPIVATEGGGDVAVWTSLHTLSSTAMDAIVVKVHYNSHKILELPHGATVYDYNGQNICLANCLTTNTTTEDMRQIIFFPNGRIAYDWKYDGATLL